MEIRLSHDENGYPRADITPPYELVGAYLEEDVQRDPEWCRELIKIVDNIIDGMEKKWMGSGNAYVLILSTEGATIRSLFLDPERICILSLSVLKQTLDAWLAFIEAESN